MGVLLIDNEAKGDIKKVIDYANEHKIGFDSMVRILDGDRPPIGDYNNYTCNLKFGFRVAFSIEEHPVGWCRHISISEDKGLPDPNIVKLILKEFGFKKELENCNKVYIEEEFAVNVVELMEI